MIFAVISLKNHKPLIAAEHPPDMFHHRGQFFFLFPLHPLNFFRPLIEGAGQQMNGQAQNGNGKPRVLHPVRIGKDRLEKQSQGSEYQIA